MEKNAQEIKNLQKKLDDERFGNIQPAELEKIIEYCELGWLACTFEKLKQFKHYLIEEGKTGPRSIYRIEVLINQKEFPTDWNKPENAKNFLTTIYEELIKRPFESWNYGSPDVNAYARGDLATQSLGILFLLSIGKAEKVHYLWKEIVTSLNSSKDDESMEVLKQEVLKRTKEKDLPPALLEMLKKTANTKSNGSGLTMPTTRGYCSALISLTVLALLHYKIADPMPKKQSYREVLQAMIDAMKDFVEIGGTCKYTPMMTHELSFMLISLYAIHKYDNSLVPCSVLEIALERLRPALTNDALCIGYRTASDSAVKETRKGSLGRAVIVNLARVLLSQQKGGEESFKRMQDLLRTIEFYSENLCYLEISLKKGGYHDGKNDLIAPYYYYATLPFAVSAIAWLPARYNEQKKKFFQNIYLSLSNVIDPYPESHDMETSDTSFPFIGEGDRKNYVYTNIMGGLALDLLVHEREHPKYFVLLG